MADIKCEIIKEIAVLSTSPKGWTKELNIVSWNDREPKYDLREWAPYHEKSGKGVTLDDFQAKELLKALQSLNL